MRWSEAVKSKSYEGLGSGSLVHKNYDAKIMVDKGEGGFEEENQCFQIW